MSTTVAANETIGELAKAGVVFGHKKSKTHPRMRPFISGTRQEIELLDPEAVITSFEKAIAFLKEKSEKGTLSVLCVGTSPAARRAVEVFAKKFKFPYVTTRWLGGTLTNHKVMMEQIRRYLDLKARQAAGELAKYTKKEQAQFSKEIGKRSKTFDGLVEYTRMPDAMIAVDVSHEAIAIKEAQDMKIPVIGILDTNDNPDPIPYPVLGNDHSKMSIEWLLQKLESGVVLKP